MARLKASRTCIILLLFSIASAFVVHCPCAGRTAGLRAKSADEVPSDSSADASTPAGLTRSEVIRGASILGYGTLLGGIFTAESSPGYVRAVGRAINGAVPQGGLNVLEVGYGKF